MNNWKTNIAAGVLSAATLFGSGDKAEAAGCEKGGMSTLFNFMSPLPADAIEAKDITDNIHFHTENFAEILDGTSESCGIMKAATLKALQTDNGKTDFVVTRFLGQFIDGSIEPQEVSLAPTFGGETSLNIKEYAVEIKLDITNPGAPSLLNNILRYAATEKECNAFGLFTINEAGKVDFKQDRFAPKTAQPRPACS